VRLASLTRVGLLALIWGSGFLWIKISLRSFTPVQLTFGRLALGAAVLVVILWRTRQALPANRTVWIHLTAAALLGNAVPYLLFGIAEQTVDSNLPGAMNATTPLWTVLFALATRTERTVGIPRAAGLALGFIGALIMLAPWNSATGTLGGAIACLAAAGCYGASYVYMGHFLTNQADGQLPPLVLSAGQLIAGSGLLLLTTPFGGFDPPTWRTDAVLSLVVLGAAGTGAAYLLIYRIITDDGPILASTVTYLLPVVAVFLGWAVLDEVLTVRVVVGVAVVLVGVTLTRRSPEIEALP
jgi:drug/metabolite transporter (DMT)-like permease